MSDESTVTLRGRFVDDISPGVKKVTDALPAMGEAARSSLKPWHQEMESLNASLQDNILRLRAQKDLLQDPVYQQSVKQAAEMRIQVDNVTRSILSRVAGTRENIAMVKAEADAEARQTEAVKAAAKAIADEHAAIMAKAQAEASSIPSVRTMTDELGKQTAAMRARLEMMRSTEGQGYIKAQQELNAEMSRLTKTTHAHNETEKGVFSNMRTRREALVMAHEAMMGQTKNLIGSAMVFAEYADLSIMHTITSMINPTTIAIGAVAAATTIATVALYEMTTKAAEHWHEMHLVAQETGATTEQMMAFEHAAIGTGVSAREMSTAMSHFTLNLSRHREELAQVGITAKDPIEAFEQLMDVAQKTADPVQRNAILNAALGESYRKLIPFVAQGGEALRGAMEEMKFPDGVKEDFEEMNNLAIANAKAWSLIKKNSSETMSGVATGWAEYKAGFMDRAAKEGLARAAMNIINPFDESLLARGRAVAEREAHGKGETAVSGGVSLEDAKAADEIIKKSRAEIRKNSMADALRDEQKSYQESIETLRRANRSTEDEERAHAMRITKIRKSFAKGSKTKGVSDSQIEGLQILIAEKSLENSIRAQMEMEGIDKSVQNAIISKDKEVAAAQEKYRKLESTKGISAAQMKSLEALEAAEIFEIVKKGNAQILAASDEADAKDAAKASASSAKRIAALNKEAEMRAALWTREEKRKQSHDERMRKIQEMRWDIQREHEEHNAKMVEGAWTSAAQGIQGVFSSAFQEIGKKNGDMMQVMADGFENLINKMIADLAANAAIFGLLSLVAPEGLAASFAANAGGLTGAIFGQKSTMLPSFDVGTRGLASDGALYGHKDEAIFPAPVSRAMHAGDWAPAMRFMGQGGGSSTTSTSSQTNHITVNVAGTNASPDDIAKSLSRALQVQQRKGARSSF